MPGILYRIFDKRFRTGLAVKNKIRIMLLKNRSEDGDFENTPFSDLYYIEAFTELSFYTELRFYKEIWFGTELRLIKIYACILPQNRELMLKYGKKFTRQESAYCFLERSSHDRGLFRSQKIRRQSL